MDKKIPFATRARYPEYLRVLRYFQSKGLEKIMSNELARELEINSTSVRRDISYLGHMGRQGYGYNISSLIDELKKYFDNFSLFININKLNWLICALIIT